MKIKDLAMLPSCSPLKPHCTSWAASRPKAVEAAGTTTSQSALERIDSQNFASAIIWA